MPQPIYIVERLNWQQAGDFWLVIPGTDLVETFESRSEAEAYCRGTRVERS